MSTSIAAPSTSAVASPTNSAGHQPKRAELIIKRTASVAGTMPRSPAEKFTIRLARLDERDAQREQRRQPADECALTISPAGTDQAMRAKQHDRHRDGDPGPPFRPGVAPATGPLAEPAPRHGHSLAGPRSIGASHFLP